MIIVTIILFSFLEPDYVKANSVLHIIFYIIRIIGILLSIIVVIKKQRILYVSLLVTLYYFVYGFSTILNGGDLTGLISDAIPIWGFVVWVEIILRYSPLKGLSILNFVYSTLVYINVLFFLVFPNGYTSYYTSAGIVVRYFLGVYNQFATYLIPAVVISVVHSMVNYNKITIQSKLLIATVSFTFIYFWSATSIIGIFLIIIYLLFVHKGWLRYMVNNKTIAVSTLILFIVVIYFNNLNAFSFIIEDLLKKDLTLSTRTRIWDIAKLMISESPYFGYGYLEGGKYVYITQSIQRSAHNTILQILLQSGFFGLLTFVLLILVFFKRVKKFKTKRITRFILFSLFTSLTMMLSEVYPLNFMYLILLLGIFTPNIIKEKAKFEGNTRIS